MKYNYEDEETTIIVDIICIVTFILLLYASFGEIKEFLDGHFGIEILLLIEFLLLSFGGSLLYVGLANIINSKYNRKIAEKIVNNGTKVAGIVTSIKTIYNPNYKKSLFKRAAFFRRKKIEYSNERVELYYHYANVQYEYKGKTYIIQTPYLYFYPYDLKSKDVDVYIYNDMFYVSNFKINRKKIKQQKQRKHMLFLIFISFLITLLLCALIVYLSIVNKWDANFSIMLIIFFFFIYFIIASIIYIKYLSNK